MPGSRSRQASPDRLVTAWSGGPIGAYARRLRPVWPPLSPILVLLLVTTATFALGVAQKASCVEAGYADQQHMPEFSWRQAERGWDTRVEGWNDRHHSFANLCYSDIAYLYRERGFADGHLAYLDAGDHRALEYPVLTGAIMQATAWLTAGFGNGAAINDSMVFFALTVVLLFGCALITVWLLGRLVPGRPYIAMFVAAAPVLALHSVINWDLVAVAVSTGALLAWSRERAGWAGVLIGLGTALKLYPVLFLAPLLFLAIRDRALSTWLWATAAAALTWLAVDLPLLVLAFDQWKEFWTFNQGRGADLGSIWLLLQLGHESTTAVNLLSLGVFVLACAAIAALTLLAPHRPTFPELTFLIVAAFCLFNKVYSPQYVLWLLPLVALARPNLRDWAMWQSAEVFYWVMVWLHLAGMTAPASGTDTLYLLAIGVRFTATAYLCVRVVRGILRPDQDGSRLGDEEVARREQGARPEATRA